MWRIAKGVNCNFGAQVITAIVVFPEAIESRKGCLANDRFKTSRQVRPGRIRLRHCLSERINAPHESSQQSAPGESVVVEQLCRGKEGTVL